MLVKKDVSVSKKVNLHLFMLVKIKVKKFNLKYSRNLLTIFNSGRKSGKFFRKSLVKFEDHKQWLEKNLKEKKTNIYLGFKNNFLKPFGYVRLTSYQKTKKFMKFQSQF